MEFQRGVGHVLRNGVFGHVHEFCSGEGGVVAPGLEICRDLLGNAGVVGRNDLAAVFPVDLVAVVGCGVVGSGNHDACTAVVG